MTPQEKYAEFQRISRSPGGLHDVVEMLFTDPTIIRKVCKDVNEMADKVIFFYNNEVIWQFTLPWNSCGEVTQKDLTDRYKFLLNQNN